MIKGENCISNKKGFKIYIIKSSITIKLELTYKITLHLY